MKIENFKINQFIILDSSEEWIQQQRIAGSCVSECLKRVKNNIELISNESSTTAKDIEALCVDIIKSYNCTPTFLGYRGFPGAICISINNQLVHGIPTNYQIKEGDVVKVDLGATYEGAIADAAISVIAGKTNNRQHIELVKVCQEALKTAIESIQVGKRIGSIGYAIDRYVKRNSNFNIVVNYCGHGISKNKPHAAPAVYNRAQPTEGVRIAPGMTLAIEPMLTIGPADTKTTSDGWTVVTNGINAHFESSVFIHENGKVEVLA
jgi:methionyl aminopeptidase